MKKRFLICALLVLVLGFTVNGTMAYFTGWDTAHNVITSGKVDISIQEWQEVDGKLVPYPKEEVSVMPGSVLSKVVEVVNHDAAAWIRAKYEVVITDEAGKQMTLTDEAMAKLVKIEVQPKWEAGTDGWWYYQDEVEEKGVTDCFFKTVEFDGPTMTNEYQNCKIDVLVSAEAVQAANNPDAAGWPVPAADE